MGMPSYVFGLTSRTFRNSRNLNKTIGRGFRQPLTTSVWLGARAKRLGDLKIGQPPPTREVSPQQTSELKTESVRRLEPEEAKQATPEILKTSTAHKYAYPERLLIWNGGVWKNAFIGFSNIASLTWMGWGLVYWAPNYMTVPELNGWYTIPAILVSAIPWLYTRWTTSPYVATVRIELPPKARTSKQALWDFAANMPPETTLEFTTVGPIGLQKRITTSLAKLSPRKPSIGFGIGNIQRADEGGRTGFEAYKRWAEGSTLYVGGDEGSVKSNVPGIWHAVMDHILEGPARHRRRTPPTRTVIKARKKK